MTGVNEIIFDDVELKSFGDHLFDEFANSVEKDDRAEGFRTVISQLVWLGDDNYGRVFEVIRPVSQVDAHIHNVDDVRKATVLV